MPILMNHDTRLALGDGAERCESRSLLFEKAPLLKTFDEYRRASLDTLLPDGKGDLQKLRNDAQTTRQKQERKRDSGERFSEKQLSNAVSLLNETASLARRTTPATAFRANPLHWLPSLPSARRRTFTLFTADRLAIGLANGVLENCGLTLHRYFGQPMIPGSALKGVAVDAARELPEVAVEANVLFATAEPGGTPERQGAIGFLAAFPVKHDARLEFDVATPHYPKYYAGTGNPTATDTENPIPIVFPVVAKGVEFRFSLVCLASRFSDAEASRLLVLAETALRHALGTRGVGAKTASGYGWFVEPAATTTSAAAAATATPSHTPAEHPAITQWRGHGHDRGNFRVMLPALASMTDITALEAALPSIVGEQAWRKFRRTDPYWQAFAANPHGKAILERISRKLT